MQPYLIVLNLNVILPVLNVEYPVQKRVDFVRRMAKLFLPMGKFWVKKGPSLAIIKNK